MWQILQQDKPDDFILATGKQHSVKEFVELAFQELDIQIDWQGEGENEIGKDSITGKEIVNVQPKYYRPSEVETLLGDATKAKDKLGWEAKTPLNLLVKKMVQSDWEKVKKNGY